VKVQSRGRFRQFLLLVPVGLVLAGCGTSLGGMIPQSPPEPEEQCADLMLAGFRGSDIDITHKAAVSDSITTTIVTIEATRPDIVPSAAIARDIAGQCKFEHHILMDFHWTKPPIR
jgi:hypothetical protein